MPLPAQASTKVRNQSGVINVIGAENVTQIETILSNDGKSLDADNFTVTWRDNIPTVITHGEEQHDQSYTFNWKDVPHRFG